MSHSPNRRKLAYFALGLVVLVSIGGGLAVLSAIGRRSYVDETELRLKECGLESADAVAYWREWSSTIVQIPEGTVELRVLAQQPRWLPGSNLKLLCLDANGAAVRTMTAAEFYQIFVSPRVHDGRDELDF